MGDPPPLSDGLKNKHVVIELWSMGTPRRDVDRLAKNSLGVTVFYRVGNNN